MYAACQGRNRRSDASDAVFYISPTYRVAACSLVARLVSRCIGDNVGDGVTCVTKRS